MQQTKGGDGGEGKGGNCVSAGVSISPGGGGGGGGGGTWGGGEGAPFGGLAFFF